MNTAFPTGKLLITGVDGTLGSNLALTLSDRFEVVGLYHRHPVALDGCQTAGCDLEDPHDVVEWVRREQPQWVIHCEPWVASSWDAYTTGETPIGQSAPAVARALVEATAAVGARLTVLSTDAVFSGPRLFHEEDAAQTGAGPLADAAFQLEQAVAGTHALVVRTHAYGWSPVDDEACFAERIWQALSEGEPARVDAERHATPILASDLAELLLSAYRLGTHGLMHITGAERTSPFRFAAELALAFGLSGRHVQLEQSEPLTEKRTRIRETSLNTRRARRMLEPPMPMLREGLGRYAAQAATGFRARLQVVRQTELVPQEAA